MIRERGNIGRVVDECADQSDNIEGMAACTKDELDVKGKDILMDKFVHTGGEEINFQKVTPYEFNNMHEDLRNYAITRTVFDFVSDTLIDVRKHSVIYY